MNALGIFFTIACCGFVLTAPRRVASLAFVVAALWLPLTQELAIGALHWSVLRIVIFAGLIRVAIRGERISGKWTGLDWMVLLWATWMIYSSAFHTGGISLTRFGEVYTDLGIYFLFRVLLRDAEDIRRFFRSVCLVLVPVAAFMVIEKITGQNGYALIYGDSGEVVTRLGHFRARGPFANAITAGTIGAISLSMALYLRRSRTGKSWVALTGLLASAAIIVSCGASGPVLTAIAILFAMAVWRVQNHLVMIRRAGLMCLVVLDLIMKDPVYYLIARIDITGGSTSYYRAALIESAMKHFDEWWRVGTDITNHWAVTQMGNLQTDITNHYLQMGVWGGMPLLILFVAGLWVAFSCVGRMLESQATDGPDERWLVWTFGSILFGQVVTFFALSYFDQANVIFLYANLAGIGTLYASPLHAAPEPVRASSCV